MQQHVEIAHIHPHLVWFFYWTGWFMHILAVAYLTCKSESNPARTIVAYVVQKWPPILIRMFLVTLGFLLWKFDPDAVNKIAQHYAQDLAPGTIHDFVMSVGLPLNALTAGAYGYVGDSLLDKLIGVTPWFKSVAPPPLLQVKVAQAEAAAKETVKAVAEVKDAAEIAKP
jgi:hypothetical protein